MTALLDAILKQEAILATAALKLEEKGGDWAPHKPTVKQKQFLDLDVKEAFYGGAAGGGKSDALLMAALQYVDVPGYAALLLRRTYADLALPGALMDRARTWLADSGAVWNDQKKQWKFPSGASITFGYLETPGDRYRYASSEFQFIAFDELTQFPELPYTFLFSRLRRLKNVNIPLRMRSASNPGGEGAQWVYNRFIRDADIRDGVYVKTSVENDEEQTRYFIPAKLDDNPHIDREGYVDSLRKLDAVTFAQLLKGDWSVRERGNIYPHWDENYHVITWSDFERVFKSRHIPRHWLLARAQDWGSTEDHPCVTVWAARAGANGPLAGSVFVYRELVCFEFIPRQVAEKIKNLERPLNEAERMHIAVMSHEAKSDRDTYSLDHDLHFTAWHGDKNGGIAQVRDYLEVIESVYPETHPQAGKPVPHPFKPGLYGQPKMFLIVDDGQYAMPEDERGLARLRAEFPVYRYAVPQSGVAMRVEPHTLFNDAMDALRYMGYHFFPAVADLTKEERFERTLPADSRIEHVAELPTEERGPAWHLREFRRAQWEKQQQPANSFNHLTSMRNRK